MSLEHRIVPGAKDVHMRQGNLLMQVTNRTVSLLRDICDFAADLRRGFAKSVDDFVRMYILKEVLLEAALQ